MDNPILLLSFYIAFSSVNEAILYTSPEPEAYEYEAISPAAVTAFDEYDDGSIAYSDYSDNILQDTVHKWLNPSHGSIFGGKPVRVVGVTSPDAVVCEINGVTRSGRRVGPNEAECITPPLEDDDLRQSVPVRVSQDNGASYMDFHRFTYVQEDWSYRVIHNNQSSYSGLRFGSTSVTYKPTDIPGAFTVNLDYVAICPGRNCTFKEVRLVSNAQNIGNIPMPSRLTQQDLLVLSVYGALRITPSQSDGRMIWSRPSISLWYLKLVFIELATRLDQSQTQPHLEIFPHPQGLDVSTKEILLAIRDFTVDRVISDVNSFDILQFVLSRISRKVCSWFYKNDRANPTIFGDLISPPCTLRDALWDMRFRRDDSCNQGSVVSRVSCDFFHKGATHCVRSTTARGKKGQQACYNSAGNILKFNKGGGTMDKYHPRDHPVNHSFFDVIPYMFCCKFSEMCDKYQEMRPTRSCTNYRRPRFAGGWGDPHFKTLDGLDYTFNAVGEFMLLQSSLNGLTIQGRMVPVTGSSRNSLSASVWNAFALKTSQSDTVHIESSYNTIQIFVNGALEEFTASPSQQFKGFDVTLSSPSEVLVVYTQADQEASLKVTGFEGVLEYILSLSSSYQGKTNGLLGNFDGNPDNDLHKRNSDVLPPTAKGLTLHNALLTWRTTEAESIFTYSQGSSHSTYQDVDFQPDFYSEESLLNLDQASLCGGDMACLYDLAVTNDTAFARRTRSASIEMEQIIAAFGTVQSQASGGLFISALLVTYIMQHFQ